MWTGETYIVYNKWPGSARCELNYWTWPCVNYPSHHSYIEPGTQAYSSNLYRCPAPVQSVISLVGVWYWIWYDRAHKHKVIINKSARTCKTDNSLAGVKSHSWLPLSVVWKARSVPASNWSLSSTGQRAVDPKNTHNKHKGKYHKSYLSVGCHKSMLSRIICRPIQYQTNILHIIISEHRDDRSPRH